MTAKWHRAACIGVALTVSAWAAPARSQKAPAAPVDPAEAIPELQNQVRMLTAQVKALQASLAQCQQEIARLNKQDDVSTPPPKVTKPSAVSHTTSVDDDNPAPAIAPGGHAVARESVYANDPGLQSARAAMDQYLKDLAPLNDKTLTDVQRAKLITEAADKLGKTLNKKICLAAVVQNVSTSTDNKAAITTQSNTVREMMAQVKLSGVAGGDAGNPTFHVTLTEDQAAMIRKGDELLVTASCTVSKDATGGSPEIVVLGIQGGWHLILGDYTCRTGTLTAKGVKPSSSKSAGKPAKTAKNPTPSGD
jgi:hypothetical protein